MPPDLLAAAHAAAAAVARAVARRVDLVMQRYGLRPPLHQVVIAGGRIVHIEHPPHCAGTDICPVSSAAARLLTQPLFDGVWHVDLTPHRMLTIEWRAVGSRG